MIRVENLRAKALSCMTAPGDAAGQGIPAIHRPARSTFGDDLVAPYLYLFGAAGA